MELYFLRHGAAEKRGDWAGDDALRPLTAAGGEAVRRVMRTLRRAGLAADAVVTSPLARALQTAEIAAAELDLGDRLVVDEGLAPGFDASALPALLGRLGRPGRVILVGHEPDFSLTIGALTGGRVVCKKGGIARVDALDDDLYTAELVWLAPPRLLTV